MQPNLQGSGALLVTLVAMQWFNPCLFVLQVLSCHDILQPPHIDFFQEVYPFTRLLTQPLCWQWPVRWSLVISCMLVLMRPAQLLPNVL